MSPVPESQTLSGRTVLVSPNETQTELTKNLEHHGARVIVWSKLNLGEPEDYQALDEAIENLFGYDWLIFENEDAVDFFLRRFQALAHEISELDALRVCGAGEAAVRKLEASHVHIDVIPDRPSLRALFDAIGTFVGGREA